MKLHPEVRQSHDIGLCDGRTKRFSGQVTPTPMIPFTVTFEAGDQIARDVDWDGHLAGDCSTRSHVIYAEGKFEVEFDAAPPAGTMLSVSYCWVSTDPDHQISSMQHRCTLPESGPDRGLKYAPLIDSCREEEDGTLWVVNGGLKLQVSYCPFCGYAANVKAANVVMKTVKPIHPYPFVVTERGCLERHHRYLWVPEGSSYGVDHPDVVFHFPVSLIPDGVHVLGKPVDMFRGKAVNTIRQYAASRDFHMNESIISLSEERAHQEIERVIRRWVTFKTRKRFVDYPTDTYPYLLYVEERYRPVQQCVEYCVCGGAKMERRELSVPCVGGGPPND